MKIIQSKERLDIAKTVIDPAGSDGNGASSNKIYGKNYFPILFPHHLRCLIIGRSSSGKTQALLSLLLDKNGVRFESVYLFGATINQLKYLVLKFCINKIPGMQFIANTEPSINLKTVKRDSVLIFDDLERFRSGPALSVIEQSYAYSRHIGIHVFSLIQNYVKISRGVRINVNCLIIFRVDAASLRLIYDEQISSHGISLREFESMCHLAWSKGPYSFIYCDLESTNKCGKFRVMFDQFIQL